MKRQRHYVYEFFDRKKQKKVTKTTLLIYTTIIYGYKKKQSDLFVYVGQTRQYLSVRDQQHLVGEKTVFDREYSRSPHLFEGPFVIKKKVFERRISDIYEQAQLQEECSKWMNEWEVSCIEQYDTYKHGLNRTPGGQKGWKMSCHLANLKKNQQMFDGSYMPAFRSYNKDGQNRLWDMPGNITINTINIGIVLINMRTRHTNVPVKHLDELNKMGYNDGKSKYDSKFDFDYMPAFRAYNNDGQNRLWDMPKNTTRNTIKIGSVLDGMRTGDTTVPVEHLDELNKMGYNDGKSNTDSKFDFDYMPAFRSYNKDGQNRLWDMPQNTTRNTVKIGTVLNSMRTGHTTVPVEHLDELNEMGYNDGKSTTDSKWEIDHMPAFRSYNKDGRNRLWDMPKNTTINTIKIGAVLVRMRKGYTTIPVKHLDELKTMGYNDGKSNIDSKWEIDYMPAFRTYGAPLHTLKYNIVLNGHTIGALFYSLKTQITRWKRLPHGVQEELCAMM